MTPKEARKEKIEYIKSTTSIVEYLAQHGFFPDPKRNRNGTKKNEVWYMSPLHKET